jgi:hypothetical protein
MALAERAQALAKRATMVPDGDVSRNKIPRNRHEKANYQTPIHSAKYKPPTPSASTDLLPPVTWAF